MANLERYEEVVSRSWREPLVGIPMYVLWNKLKILKPILKKLSKPLAHVQQNITKARIDPEKA